MRINKKYNNSKNKPTVRKTLRLAKNNQRLPKGDIIIEGRTSSNSVKTFHFKVISSAQQIKERNKAYKFFSID